MAKNANKGRSWARIAVDAVMAALFVFIFATYGDLTGTTGGALRWILPSLILSFFIARPAVILLFAAAYLGGTALSILLASRENLMALLSEKE